MEICRFCNQMWRDRSCSNSHLSRAPPHMSTISLIQISIFFFYIQATFWIFCPHVHTDDSVPVSNVPHLRSQSQGAGRGVPGVPERPSVEQVSLQVKNKVWL